MSVGADNEYVSVYHGKTHLRLSVQKFRSAFFDGIDSKTVVSFWKKQNDETLEAESLLLDMQAGSSDGESGESVASGQPHLVLEDPDEQFRFADTISEALAAEVEECLNGLPGTVRRQDGRAKCPFCPFRSFKRLQHLRHHIRKHHSDNSQYVCSGTKQIKVICALHDHTSVRQVAERSYLSRSAQILADSIVPALCHSKNSIDKDIRLIFTGEGPRYVNAEAMGTVRRVKNLYYDHAFADQVLREMVLQSGQVSRLTAADGMCVCVCCCLCRGSRFGSSCLR